MEEWGRPAPPSAPRPSPTPAASGGASAASPPVPSAGFGASFRSLVGRKLRELTGQRWGAASERARHAEAARRGAAEMARRIERQTGQRPAQSTIRRAASQDRTPRGADQVRLDRQSRIDTAGGIKPFAQQAGVNPSAVPRWRDSGAVMAPGGVRVIADVEGVLWAEGDSYPRSMTVSVSVGLPAADEIRAAYAAYDLEAIGEMLGPVITAQTDWAGDADRRYQVEAINDVTIT